jgi:UDP-galactopyranose mutase
MKNWNEGPSNYMSLRSQIPEAGADLVCFSHLRWDFVYQRPQHLLSRCTRERRVFFVEEPVFYEGEPRLEVSSRSGGVRVVVPRVPRHLQGRCELDNTLAGLMDDLFADHEINSCILWYYTPMAMAWTDRLAPLAVVYDCMDELSAFKGAPPEMKAREEALFRRADLVFTGGESLYQVKRHQHSDVRAFPSSIDAAHFAQARTPMRDPLDQSAIPYPRLGFFGVIDERMDLEMLQDIARSRPDWQLVMIGPVVKIDPADLPRGDNIHYMGAKSYGELPAYIAGWNVALMPFARNESTRFISPTKTPEYLAAGRPVVSTSIQDVVHPYGEAGLVRIADSAADFIAAIERAMSEDAESRIREVDAFLARSSWDRTWKRMNDLIEEVVARRLRTSALPPTGIELPERTAPATAFVAGD